MPNSTSSPPLCKFRTNHLNRNKSPDDRELGTGFAHVFDQFVDQFGGGATGRRRAGADRGRAGVCRGAAFVGPTRRRREVAVAEEGRGRADEDAARVTVAEAGRATEADDGRGRAAETEAGRAADADDGRTAEAEAGRVPNRDRFFCEVAAAAARARLILRLSGRGGLPALKASLWRRPRVGGRCRFCLMNVGFPRCASASSNPRMRRSWGSKCVSWMLYSSSP